MIKNAVIGFYGESNSGKTNLIIEIIQSLTKEGLKIAAIKQSDKNINIDTEGKDTWKYHEAGATFIVLSSANNTDILIDKKLEIKKIVDIISEYDLFDVVLIEGANDSQIPKIKVGNGSLRDNTIMQYKDDFNGIIDLIKNEIEKKKIKQKIKIEVNGAEIPLSEFPADIITSTLTGLISSLKGVEKINNLKICLNLSSK